MYMPTSTGKLSCAAANDDDFATKPNYAEDHNTAATIIDFCRETIGPHGRTFSCVQERAKSRRNLTRLLIVVAIDRPKSAATHGILPRNLHFLSSEKDKRNAPV